MNSLLLAGLADALLGWLVAFLSVFLVMLVLIQRGKGGGLTGALGGPGGQSAFGSKAGDTFTVITIVVASIWGFTCAFMKWRSTTPVSIPVATSTLKAGPGDELNTDPTMPFESIPEMGGGLEPATSDTFEDSSGSADAGAETVQPSGTVQPGGAESAAADAESSATSDSSPALEAPGNEPPAAEPPAAEPPAATENESDGTP